MATTFLADRVVTALLSLLYSLDKAARVPARRDASTPGLISVAPSVDHGEGAYAVIIDRRRRIQIYGLSITRRRYGHRPTEGNVDLSSVVLLYGAVGTGAVGTVGIDLKERCTVEECGE